MPRQIQVSFNNRSPPSILLPDEQFVIPKAGKKICCHPKLEGNFFPVPNKKLFRCIVRCSEQAGLPQVIRCFRMTSRSSPVKLFMNIYTYFFPKFFSKLNNVTTSCMVSLISVRSPAGKGVVQQSIQDRYGNRPHTHTEIGYGKRRRRSRRRRRRSRRRRRRRSRRRSSTLLHSIPCVPTFVYFFLLTPPI